MKKVKIILLLVVLFNMSQTTYAQKYKWTKYYMEMGLLGGGSFYLGDVNHKLFANMQPTAGLYLKYKFDGHWETKLQFTGGQAGITKMENEHQKTTFFDAAAIAEFNFFNFGAMSLEPYASRVSSYIFAGLGAAYFNQNIAPIVPFGVGVKWNFVKRFNLGAYWSMQKILWNDNFDMVSNPLKLGVNMWKNNDWYSTAAIFISFDFWEICPSCRDGSKDYYYSK